MLRKIISLLMCCIMLVTVVACNGIDGIATVDEESIDEEYFRYYFTEWKKKMQSQHGEDTWQDATLEGKPALEYVRERALQAVIEDKIIMVKAQEDGIKLTSEDSKNIADNKQQWINLYGGKEEFLTAIEEVYGLSEEQFDYMMEAVYYRNHLIDKYVTVNDSEILEYYTNNIAKVKSISIATVDLSTGMPLSEEEVTEAKQKVAHIQAELEKGKDFDLLVSEYAKDQGVFCYVGKGYCLAEDGSQDSSMVSVEFEEASLFLGVGEISNVVESADGYHIIKRYENDSEMYNKSKDVLSFIIKTEAFTGVIGKWKDEVNVVINDEMYNSYE